MFERTLFVIIAELALALGLSLGEIKQHNADSDMCVHGEVKNG